MPVVVGREQQVFNIHKELLCAASSYFSAAFKGNFKEADTQRIEILDEDVTVFKYFQVWLYSKKVHTTEDLLNDVAWELLLNFYIFAVSATICVQREMLISKCAGCAWHTRSSEYCC